ncbi:hypothetical protein CW749_13355 [Vibrio sp. vnigr-6D03]|nr:hypothetical protein CW749_13355 [Vibrio sp. vnigr-6D03]
MRKLFAYVGLTLLSFVTNFFIYNYSFNVQATPFLHEEQRVESAMLMFQTTLPAYFLSSLLLTFLFFLVARKIK